MATDRVQTLRPLPVPRKITLPRATLFQLAQRAHEQELLGAMGTVT